MIIKKEIKNGIEIFYVKKAEIINFLFIKNII